MRLDDRLLLFAAGIAAVAVPGAAWHFTSGDERLALGLTAAPFAWPRLLVGHLVAALPLAFCSAGRIAMLGRPLHRAWAAAGLTLVLTLVLPTLADGLDQAKAGFTIRAVMRTILAVLVTTAWLSIAGRAGTASAKWTWLASIIFALLPPLVYADRIAESRATDFLTFAKSDRLMRAMGTLEGLRDLGSDRRFTNKTVAELIPRLRKDLDRIAAIVAKPLPAGATAEDKPARALNLLRLNRLAEAEAILNGLDAPTPETWMIRAALARETARWNDLETACRAVIDRADPNAKSTEMLEDAYEGLGEAQRKRQRPSDAAETYRIGAERLPNRAGYFRYLHGLLAADQGRPREALDAFADAVRLDPKLAPLVDPQARSVRTTSLSCLGR